MFYTFAGVAVLGALTVVAPVVSVSPKGWAVADVGLKSLGMDHGNPEVDGCGVFFCSDEHTTVLPEGDTRLRVGDRVRAEVHGRIRIVEVVRLAQRGDLRYSVERLPLEGAAEAHRRIRTGDVDGRLVLIP